MSDQLSFRIVVSHDRQNGVWFVVDSDIPGLNAEADSLDALVEVVTDLAPELIEANLDDWDRDMPEIPLCVQHLVNVKRAHAA